MTYETPQEKTKMVLQKIAAKRREMGISQWDFGKKLNLGEGGYFKVEKGGTKLDMLRFFQILEHQGITAKAFFNDFD